MKTYLSIFLIGFLCAGCLGRRTTNDNSDNGTATDSAVVATASAPASDSISRADTANRTFTRHGPFVENDTTFLFQSSDYNPYGGYIRHCRAYIDKNRDSESHRLLDACSTPDYDDWSRDNFAQSLDILKKERHPGSFPVHSLQDCPRTWIPIDSYRGEYYVDMLYWYPIWINDSLFVRQMMDGPYPSVIDAFERIDPAHYRFRTTAGYPDVQQADIFIVDSVRKIAVFAFSNDNDSRKKPLFYGLYAPLETARELDLVEWDFTDLPDGDEIAWDRLDFEAMIAGRISGDADRNIENEREE